jgi:hypothetical protein
LDGGGFVEAFFEAQGYWVGFNCDACQARRSMNAMANAIPAVRL